MPAGIVAAVGTAVLPVTLATTVLADSVARPASGKPVPLVSVTADGVPRFGVTNVGDVAKTGEPDPVAAFPSPVATPVPRPLTPVEIGKPVAFVRVNVVGVPRFES